nr:ribonuclease H-like domain-containing protein [Tanacetum cinerariifolium]
MKVVPPPLTRDYTSLSDHTDLDESQKSYGTKSSSFCDPKYVPNDFVSCDDSDKSLEVNSNHSASSDSGVKSLEHKPVDSTSCASTSSVKPVPTGKPKVTPVPTGKPKVTPVPTGKPQVSTPVPTGNSFLATKDEGIFNSGCSRSMTGNKERLDNFQAFHGVKVTFGGGEGRITRKGTIHTPTLDFENVYYVKELQQFNLFSISQIYDKKNQVLFTDIECLVLSKDFKLPDDSMVVLKVPRKYNLYTINLNDLCPRGNLACLVAHASFDESVKWHRRIAHVNYKT